MDSHLLYFIIPLAILLLLSGFFSASETALFSLPYMRIKAYQSSPNPRKRLVARLVLSPRDLLVTVFMLNTLINILLQNTTSAMFGEFGGWGLKVALPFLLTLIFGEIIPKNIGLQNNTKLAAAVAPSINIIQKILKPIRKAIIKVTEPVSHALFFFLKKEKSISKEELQHVLKTSQETGVLHADEAELLYGYLNFQDKLVKELMQPRDAILYYDINEPLTKLTYLFVDQKCSRIPVCKDEIQNLLGIMTAKKFFIHKQAINTSEDLEKLLLKPVYVPETALARSMLRRFHETRQEIAIVVDEYGSISGLITYEDLVEVVIGEITDLRDAVTLYTKSKDNEIVCSGRLELDEFNQIFSTDLSSSNNMVTLGGWLIEKMGEIPAPGMKYETDQFLFQVLMADSNKIQRLFVRKLKK